jgi:hypothetical protein
MPMLVGLANRKGMLDTVEVNGPEGVFDWTAVDWRVHEQDVARLRRRIFKATREQDWATVRSLQKLMLGSWSNTLVSVRQVTQRNTGRRDGRYRRRGRLVVAGVGGDGGACAPQPLGLGPVAGLYIPRRIADWRKRIGTAGSARRRCRARTCTVRRAGMLTGLRNAANLAFKLALVDRGRYLDRSSGGSV